ncbi:uncharacterized protein DUF1800 [Pseudoduganella flava]|nr:uncharacterized protein DUF1800 [Pseudoduganella flava]
MYEINQVASMGKLNWLNAQFNVYPAWHRAYMDQMATTLPPRAVLSENHFFQSFWKNAIIGSDHLRERVTYALSQIFVVSFQDGAVGMYARGMACYYDMLSAKAFGNFRDLLEGVATSPMMGIYLSHMQNLPESENSTPDENFAREIMQLMTIGLHQLNPDGTVKLSGGQPIPTYNRDDVAGLAKVFTGWSWGGGQMNEYGFTGLVAYSSPDRDCLPMQNYPAYHSTSKKTFLGKTLAAGGSGEADLKAALDTLFNHPNVGPFIGRQLIQRLVKSNPSAGYVARVAAAFADNGAGVRGDMKAVLRAVLLDSEAAAAGADDVGKLREPVLRLANWLRAFNARSVSGNYVIWTLEDPLTGIGQNPLRSPSVFNFYRPNYTPPHTSIANAGYVAPEMQLVGETSVIGYLNFMQMAVARGIGQSWDIRPNYAAELSIAEQPEMLVDRINLLLLNGRMSDSLRSKIVSAVASIPVRGNSPQAQTAKENRVYIAVYLTMAAPEYLVQK